MLGPSTRTGSTNCHGCCSPYLPVRKRTCRCLHLRQFMGHSWCSLDISYRCRSCPLTCFCHSLLTAMSGFQSVWTRHKVPANSLPSELPDGLLSGPTCLSGKMDIERPWRMLMMAPSMSCSGRAIASSSNLVTEQTLWLCIV